jgi:hypothetical protein
MMKCSDEDKQPKDEFRYSLPEGAKNLNDVFLPEFISVPDPVSVHDFAIALWMKPHLLIAGLLRLNSFATQYADRLQHGFNPMFTVWCYCT